MEEADSEAQRLNALRDDQRVRYVSAAVKWFPEGRDVQVGY